MGPPDPAKPTGDPEKWVTDAVSAGAACKKLGFGRGSGS